MSRKVRPTPVSAALVQTVEKLTEQLKAEFGTDFSFTIMGEGHFVARHNIEGIIKPVTDHASAELQALQAYANGGPL